MKIIEVHKAQATGDEIIESTTLLLHDEIPELSRRTQHPADEFYKAEAKQIMKALSVLPQGTKYQLLCMMLESALVMYRGK